MTRGWAYSDLPVKMGLLPRLLNIDRQHSVQTSHQTRKPAPTMEPRPLVELEATAMEAELGRRAHDPTDLAHVLVSELCSATTSNSPALWKLLDRGLSSRLLSPLLCFSLLAPRYARVMCSYSLRHRALSADSPFVLF